MAPTATAARTLRYHTYSLTLLGHRGNIQMAIVAITVKQKREKTVNILLNYKCAVKLVPVPRKQAL